MQQMGMSPAKFMNFCQKLIVTQLAFLFLTQKIAMLATQIAAIGDINGDSQRKPNAKKDLFEKSLNIFKKPHNKDAWKRGDILDEAE
jgi:hypothetical protein